MGGGTAASTTLDYGLRPLVTNGERPAMTLKETFLVGSFVESLPSASSRYVTQLYDQAKEIEESYGSYREALKSGDIDKAKSIMESERDKLNKYKMVERVKRQEAAISSQIKMVERSESMTADEKRERIDQLKERRHQLARQFAGRQAAMTAP